MGERERLCVACNSPSPGPAKRLYYQHRDFGPFFPILEIQRRKSNNFLFSGGRAVVCTGCASHLFRQWSAYEQKWTPLQRRTYTLLSEEREAKKAKKASISSEITHNSYDFSPRRKGPSQNKMLQVFNPEGNDSLHVSPNGGFASSFITEDTSPFRRAVKQVSKQNTRALNESSKISDVFETVIHQNRYAKEQEPSNKTVNGNEILPRKNSPFAIMSLPNDDIRFKVREELRENVEVMIRKLAEIQHVENMRRYEQELQEAAQRICGAQDRESDIDRMCRNLKRQLKEELMFRDTSRVLRDSEQLQRRVPSMNAAIQTNELAVNHKGRDSATAREPFANHPKGLESVTVAKKAGSEWKGKAKKGRTRKETYSPKHNPQTPLRTQSETLPRDIVKEPQPQPRSAQNIDAVLRELEQEREWRKKTENAMIRQREMIEELRKGIQGDVQRLIEEQNNRYQELKETLAAYKGAKKSQTRSQPRPERKSTAENRSKAKPSSKWRRNSDDISIIRQDDDVSDQSDDITDDDDDDDNDDDDSHDEDSSPRTPEYYIH